MKNVRKDVRQKLVNMLVEKREKQKENRASLQNYIQYDTRKCTHCLRYIPEKEKLYFNSILFDGTHCHTEENLDNYSTEFFFVR